MDVPPLGAQRWQHVSQNVADTIHLPILETVVETKLWWFVRAVQCEDRLAAASDHVNVRGPVIVWIDDHTQIIETVNGRHAPI